MTKTMSVLDRTQEETGPESEDDFVRALLSKMSLEDKIGQLQQVDASGDTISDALRDAVRAGKIGAIINQVDPSVCDAFQKIAVEESPHGIPLLIGRDVIHGFKTIFPIPLGQAATWNPELIEACARVSAEEASAAGVNWTFSPMIDISRDARWGRIAESFGEDPFLTATLGASMIRGYQGEDLSAPNTIAACAKHFVGYGASESGRDYDTTNIPLNELHNIYLPPFKAAADAGVATFMTSFGDIDGVPASGNEYILKNVLRESWQYDGLVVSDWDSVRQLSVHGLTDGDRNAAKEAVSAGVDMEMAGSAYAAHLADLVADGEIDLSRVNELTENVLRLKFRLGLFSAPYARPEACTLPCAQEKLDLAKQAAIESTVLLENKGGLLPLDASRMNRVAVIGPMSDQPYEQLGTWIFDGDEALSQTPLAAFRASLPAHVQLDYIQTLETTRARDTDDFEAAKLAATNADIAFVFLGEESILSGEAHSRADINLPGAQSALLEQLSATGTPVVCVIMAGRPLTISDVVENSDAVLFAWHGGTMSGPALYELIFGLASPSGRLPVTFPKMVGQIPIYYNHKSTGRPASDNQITHIDDIEVGAKQTSFGMTAFHLDAGFRPLFPFGFGLSYGKIVYDDLQLDRHQISPNESIRISARITNCGKYAASETAQLYIRDVAASVTRPVRELKSFQKIHLQPGETETVVFELTERDLAFYRRNKSVGTEPGEFQVWVGANADAGLTARFVLEA